MPSRGRPTVHPHLYSRLGPIPVHLRKYMYMHNCFSNFLILRPGFWVYSCGDALQRLCVDLGEWYGSEEEFTKYVRGDLRQELLDMSAIDLPLSYLEN